MARRVKLDNYALPDAPRLGAGGWGRWMWRQVTSMRVALILLLLLGLAAIPGSVFPQRAQNPAKVNDYLAAHPGAGKVLDALDAFDVFSSPWFISIYVLLVLSLVGCIVPRTFRYARAFRDIPGPAPSSLARYDVTAKAKVKDPRAALERAAAGLRTGLIPYRTRIEERKTRGGASELAMAAEQGHVREMGNLAFHVGIVLIVIAASVGSFLTYRGQALVVEGRSFTNSVVAYDTFEPGRGFNPEWLEPVSVRLDKLDASFDMTGRPLDFEASVTVTEVDGATRTGTIKVNHPLSAGGAKLFLSGNGYAPDFTVRDADGNVAFAGPVPFLPQDAAYTSTGVVKVPDVTSGDQIGIRGTLLPSAVASGDGVVSIHPDPNNPVIVFQVFTGNLGLDTGVPQNVYVLDESQLSPVRNDAGDVATFFISPGETVDLPNGLGSVTFESLPRFAALDIHSDPTLPYLLAAAVITLLGVTLSLFGSRRRVWLIVPSAGPATVVGAAYVPFHDPELPALLARVMASLKEDE